MYDSIKQGLFWYVLGRMALTEAISSDQLSFEDGARLLHSGKTLGSSFGDSRFCPMRTQGNELITDDMEQGRGNDLGGCLSQLRSELIELLSSSLQGHPQGNTCDCCADCHIKLRSKLYKQMHPNFFLHHFRFWQNHLHLQSRFEMLEIPLLASAVDRGGRV